MKPKSKKKSFEMMPEDTWIETRIQNSPYRGTKAAILRKIAVLSRKDGYCYSSHKHLAKNCNIAERTLIRHLKDLEDDAVLVIDHRVGTKGQNHYSICTDGLRDIRKPSNSKPSRWKQYSNKKTATMEAMAKQLVAVTALTLIGCENATNLVALPNCPSDNAVIAGCDTHVTQSDRIVRAGCDRIVRQIECEQSLQVLSINRRADCSPSDIDSEFQNQKNQNQKQKQELENPFHPDSFESFMMDTLAGKRPVGFTEVALVPSTNSPDASPWAPEGCGGAEAVPSMEVHPEIVKHELDVILEQYFQDR